ncbi:hypothetical protein, partial [Azospirillum sp. TSO5]|uniref:hypothetical protein n=1 Tax=Azospirillum sp. TSO5 TaxID=716760 RepID=UPI001B3C0974
YSTFPSLSFWFVPISRTIWSLSCSDPKYLRLMPTERVEVTGKDGGPIETKATVDLSSLSVEELEALNAAAAKVKKAEG